MKKLSHAILGLSPYLLAAGLVIPDWKDAFYWVGLVLSCVVISSLYLFGTIIIQARREEKIRIIEEIHDA